MGISAVRVDFPGREKQKSEGALYFGQNHFFGFLLLANPSIFSKVLWFFFGSFFAFFFSKRSSPLSVAHSQHVGVWALSLFLPSLGAFFVNFQKYPNQSK